MSLKECILPVHMVYYTLLLSLPPSLLYNTGTIIHSSNIFKVRMKVFVGHREGIYGEGLQSVQALVKSFALNIPN